jgi:hypothetical protein
MAMMRTRVQTFVMIIAHSIGDDQEQLAETTEQHSTLA